MKNLKTLFIHFILVLFVLGCTKTIGEIEPPVNPSVNPPATPNTDKPTGVFYVKTNGNFIKINANDSTVFWTSKNMNAFASYGNPITLDSNNFYYGNYGGLLPIIQLPERRGGYSPGLHSMMPSPSGNQHLQTV